MIYVNIAYRIRGVNFMKETKSLLSYNKKGKILNVEEISTYVKIKKRHFKKGEFYMVSFDLDRLILENNYGAPVIRVLLVLKTKLDFNNRIKTFRQADVAKEAKTSQANVSRALKQLEKDRVILRDGLDYYFNEKFIKGAGDNKKK